MTENLLTLWARVLATTLVELGVRHVVISPGSRSTPFVVAVLAEPKLTSHVLVDERTAGFFALGIARATGTVPALLCTSGSAGAHYLPAVVEADASALPLVVITADRPAELEECNAPQTSNHREFFGGFVRASLDLAGPSPRRAAFLALRRKVAQGYAAALGAFPGPVHLNARADKPLEPRQASSPEGVALETEVEALLAEPVPRQAASQILPSAADVTSVTALLASRRRGVVIAGPTSEPGVREALERLATQLGYPLLAETTSQARFGPAIRGLVRAPHFELALRCKAGRAALVPDLAIVVGQTPTSAAWEQVASSSAVEQVTIARQPWSDPSNRARWLFRGPVVASMTALSDAVGAGLAADEAWSKSWADAEDACERTVADALARWGEDSEGRVIHRLSAAVPDDAILFVGNSLAVREVDVLGAARTSGPEVLSQRGVNGIDGAVSGASGVAIATGRKVVALVGDITFLHDIGGLAVARRVATPLVFVVVNNGGGRIFDLLPLAAVRSDMSAWTTPQEHVLADITRGFGVAHVVSRDEATFDDAFRRAIETRGTTCIEVMVAGDSARREQAEVLDRLEQALRASLGDRAARL